MPPRKVNLLEAFKASQQAPEAPAAPAPRSAPSRPAARRVAPVVVERAPIYVGLSVGALLLLGGAFWLGRITAPNADARSSTGPGAAPERESAGWDAPLESAAWNETEPAPAGEPSVELDPEGRTADDLAFYDKTNRFTVRAIYYANTSKGWKRALATYRYLRAQGLPAVAPIDQGENLVLCVGAAPVREGELTELSRRLQSLPGPPPQSEEAAFAGAFFVNIDDLIERP